MGGDWGNTEQSVQRPWGWTSQESKGCEKQEGRRGTLVPGAHMLGQGRDQRSPAATGAVTDGPARQRTLTSHTLLSHAEEHGSHNSAQTNLWNALSEPDSVTAMYRTEGSKVKRTLVDAVWARGGAT